MQKIFLKCICQFNGYYHGEAESACDLTVVIVPFLDLWLTSSKVGADKADASGVEQQANGHTSFIASSPTHSSFYSIDSNIPGKGIEWQSVSIHVIYRISA